MDLQLIPGTMDATGTLPKKENPPRLQQAVGPSTTETSPLLQCAAPVEVGKVSQPATITQQPETSVVMDVTGTGTIQTSVATGMAPISRLLPIVAAFAVAHLLLQ